MKTQILRTALVVFILICTSNLRAELITEAVAGSGYQSNLFNDSNSTGDTYASIGIGLKYYPSNSTEFKVGGAYNAFADNKDLSNFTGDLSFTIIPTPESSPFSVALKGGLAVRKFGVQYNLYNQVGVAVGADIGYRLTQKIYLQSSAEYLNNSYSKSDFGSNRGFDVTTGFNLSFLGSNSLALSFDYSHRSLDQPSLVQDGEVNSIIESSSQSDAFELTGMQLRYSRPLGERTGLKFSFGHRRLHVDNNYAVLGYTIDYLSPWSDLWEGSSLSAGLKQIFPHQIIANLSFAYFDKSYVDVIEFGDTDIESYWIDTRDDQLSTLSLSISRPVLLPSGKQLTPTLYLGYRNNQSSIEFFDYEDIQASFTLTMRL